MREFPEIYYLVPSFMCGFAATRNAAFALTVFWRSRFPLSSCIGNQNAGLVLMLVILARPHGFCVGVRAIEIVERSLERHGAPVLCAP
jgi:hypothetical protein